MDSFTQIVLGAATGEAVLGKKIGNKALLWGAIAGTIPDLDVLVGMITDPVSALEMHRGVSHSILFSIVCAPVFGWLLWKLYRNRSDNASFKGWSWLFFWGLFTHPLLDCFTSWGTQLFWPLSPRIAFNSVFVVDPGYTLPFLICCIIVLFLKRQSKKRRIVNWIGIGLSSGYLLFTVVNKMYINSVFKEALAEQQIEYNRISTRPAPLSNILWAANVEFEQGFYLGYYSLLDSHKDISFDLVSKDHALLDPIREEDKVQRLIKITKGYYSVENPEPNYWVINDLRFGRSVNWKTGKPGKFIFAYHIFKESDGEIRVEQSTNNPKDAKKMAGSLFKRIGGI